MTGTKTVVLNHGGSGIETIENVESATTRWASETTVTCTHPDGSTTTRTSAAVRIQAFRDE